VAVTLCAAFVGALLATSLTGCAAAPTGGTPAGSTEATTTKGAAMGGPVVDVKVTQAAIDSKPAAPVLTSPESAVRSYLDWTSYAYRIAQSDAATPTMTGPEGVRVDSYVQLNIQQYRVIDQILRSVKFGKAKVKGGTAVLPATENWAYRYVSIQTLGKVLEGPYSVSYETTYTVTKSAAGTWLVDSVEAKALGEVK
jgi:hypothetical protein